jgi:DNA-binding transcriptional LysR family regulator
MLTAQGVELTAFARDLLGRGAAFTGRLRGEVKESVTLAAGEGAYLYLLGPALTAFAKDPARLELLTLGGPAACSAVQLGQAHLAVGVFDLVPRGLHAQELLTTRLCAALPARHHLAKASRLALKDLAGERMILAPEGQSHRTLVGRALASIGSTVEQHIEADGWPLMLAFVAAELGVAVVNGICRPPPGVVLRPIPELGVVKYRLLTRGAPQRGGPAHRLAEAVKRSSSGT